MTPTPATNLQAASTASFDDLRFQAAGGLGEVYRATERDLRREVALKFIQARHCQNPEFVNLFLLEAEITSRLDHPGVVPVFGMGHASDGRPFYAMRFIEGMQLRVLIEEFHQQGQPRRELLRLLNHLVAVCKTIAYAHNRGVVHCDLKPENVMLGKYGETLVVDWGLATTVERDERAKASGEKTMRVDWSTESGKSSGGTAGTVGYMSPEQHPGFQRPITPACDIYSLGATLYCILTNKAPLQGPEETMLLDQLRFGQFPPPSAINPKTPRVLEAICLKAMATHRADRYPTAMDLAGDLEAYLDDEPVSVYREPLIERAWRWSRRHRSWVVSGLAAASLVVIVSSLAAVGLGKTAARELHARHDADAARLDAIDAQKSARQAQFNGMRLAARFAAKAVANEIEMRFQILTHVAASPELQTLMQALTENRVGTPEQKALQEWLAAQRAANSAESDSWFLTNRAGVQIARVPFSESSIFADFSGRTYFHGGDRSLSKGVRSEPIAGAHLSSVYLSTASHTLKVAFSVPVWSSTAEKRECLGVLGMSVELGAFRELQTGLNDGQIAVLVDTRVDETDGAPKRGLILHHPALQSLLAKDTESPAARIAPGLVEKLEQLAESTTDAAQTIVEDYHDPLATDETNAVTAAIAPVRFGGRSAKPKNSGWFVIVQEAK